VGTENNRYGEWKDIRTRREKSESETERQEREERRTKEKEAEGCTEDWEEQHEAGRRRKPIAW
jgi:hypothetical protein